MKMASLEKIFSSLNRAGVRYLVAGGLAVNAHGYQRLTVDLDLVIHLKKPNILAAFEALSALGYHPTVPVTEEEFADPDNRKKWFDEKQMRVLNLFSDEHPETPLDIFVQEPFDFEKAYKSAMRVALFPGLVVSFVSVSALIEMKGNTGRLRDQDDIDHLNMLLEELNHDSR